MNFTNEICPVCQRAFNENDDIVVCPDCGTPHHRECWSIKNVCENSALHGTGFEWKPSENTEKEENTFTLPTAETDVQQTDAQNIPAFGGRMATQEEIEDLMLAGSGIKKDDTFDGIRAGDAALYIQQNARRYIKKFSRNTVTFNWAAFFFTPAWYFFRKMYKAGAAFLALFIALTLFTYPLAEKVNSQSKAINSRIEQMQSSDESLSNEDIAKEIMSDSEFYATVKSCAKSCALYYGASVIAPGLLSGFLANYLYKKKMRQDIAKAKEESKDQNIRFEKALIMRKGGVSFLLGAIVFFGATYIPELFLYIGKYFSNIF